MKQYQVFFICGCIFLANSLLSTNIATSIFSFIMTISLLIAAIVFNKLESEVEDAINNIRLLEFDILITLIKTTNAHLGKLVELNMSKQKKRRTKK